MNVIKNILLFFLIRLKFTASPDFFHQLVAEHPDREKFPSSKVFVVGGNGFQKWAYLRCPCGCNDFIMLSLSNKTRPSWSVTKDFFNRPTIYPSIRQTSGCMSHFWIRKGKIEWCEDSGKSSIYNAKNAVPYL